MAERNTVKTVPSPRKSLITSELLSGVSLEEETTIVPAPSHQFQKGHPELRNGKVSRSGSEQIRRFIESTKKSDVDPIRGQTRLIQMTANMVRLACSNKSPLAVSAYEALMNRAYGRPKPSNEEADAIAKGGIKILYVNSPQLDPEIEQVKGETAPAVTSAPDFVEGEVVEDE